MDPSWRWLGLLWSLGTASCADGLRKGSPSPRQDADRLLSVSGYQMWLQRVESDALCRCKHKGIGIVLRACKIIHAFMDINSIFQIGFGF